MINKLKNKWWLFTILTGICAYLDPYFGLFSIFILIVLFFDFIMFIIMNGHFNIFSKKISDRVEHINIIKKTFSKEVLSFKIGKLFTTVFMVFVMLVVVIQNIETKKIMTPFYISAVQKNFALQILCIVLAIASIIFSFILFWSYSDSYKQKLNELG